MNPDDGLESLRQRLRALPEESPPPSVWAMLQARHALDFRKPRPQRWRIAVAAALLLVAPLLVWRIPEAPIEPLAPGFDAVELRAIDRELQLRYLDGASDEELAPLWRQRAELLRRGTTVDPTPATLSI